MTARRTLATRIACVALALCASRVAADCASPDSFGNLYEVDQHDAPPHLEDDALVVRVSGAGLDACAVPAPDQFSLTWLKEADMAILKLRRDAPAECADADPSEGFVELRVPLPESSVAAPTISPACSSVFLPAVRTRRTSCTTTAC